MSDVIKGMKDGKEAMRIVGDKIIVTDKDLIAKLTKEELDEVKNEIEIKDSEKGLN